MMGASGTDGHRRRRDDTGEGCPPPGRGAGADSTPGSAWVAAGGRCESSANGGGPASDTSCPLRSSCCPRVSRPQ